MSAVSGRMVLVRTNWTFRRRERRGSPGSSDRRKRARASWSVLYRAARVEPKPLRRYASGYVVGQQRKHDPALVRTEAGGDGVLQDAGQPGHLRHIRR